MQIRHNLSYFHTSRQMMLFLLVAGCLMFCTQNISATVPASSADIAAADTRELLRKIRVIIDRGELRDTRLIEKTFGISLKVDKYNDNNDDGVTNTFIFNAPGPDVMFYSISLGLQPRPTFGDQAELASLQINMPRKSCVQGADLDKLFQMPASFDGPMPEDHVRNYDFMIGKTHFVTDSSVVANGCIPALIIVQLSGEK